MRIFLTALILVVAIGSTATALASLGGDAGSVDSDELALGGGQRKTIQHPSFTIEEITTNAGVVREYLNANGKIFAITWTGQSHPDLRPLLGDSYKEFRRTSAREPRRHGIRQQSVTTPSHVVVERRGHMRRVQGRAIDPSLVPQGVSVDDIN